MRIVRVTTILLIFISVMIQGCGKITHCNPDTAGLSFATNQPYYPDGYQVDGAISNLSSESITVNPWTDVVAYKKEHGGWVAQYPCSDLIILPDKEIVVQSGSTWEIDADMFDIVTCISGQEFLLDEKFEGVFVFSMGYRNNACDGTEKPALVLYSNEFQVGQTESTDGDFEVSVEPDGFLGFSLRNHTDHLIWYIPSQCATMGDYEGYQGLFSAPYVLQRQTDANAWEIFYPGGTECQETVARMPIEAGEMLKIEAHLNSSYNQDGWPAGTYRWKSLYQPDLSDWHRRHIFSHVFEYDGTTVTAMP